MSPRPRRSGVRIWKRRWTGATGEPRSAWSAQWRAFDGRKKTKGGFPTKGAAEAYVNREVIPALEEGHDSPADRRAANPLLGDLVALYIARKKPELRASSFRLIGRTAEEFAEFLGTSRPVESVSRFDVERFATRPLQNGSAPSAWTQQHRRSVAARVLGMAVRLGIISRSPAGDAAVAPAQSRLRFFSTEEIRRILEAAKRPDVPDEALAYVALGIYAGLRKGEIHTLRWSRVNLDTDKPTLTVESDNESEWEPKTPASTRTIGVPPHLAEILREHRKMQRSAWKAQRELSRRVVALVDGSTDNRSLAARLRLIGYLGAREHAPLGFKKIQAIERGRLELIDWQEKRDLLFPATRVGVWHRQNSPQFWNVIRGRAGIADVPFHVTRHTFASHAVMNGMSLSELAAVLGHSSISMVLRYAHLAPTHVQAAARALPDFAETKREQGP